MYSLSLFQPWAQAVVDGAKKIETRSWYTKIRGELAIHAVAMKPNKYLAEQTRGDCRRFGYDPDKVAFGAVLGTVELVECVCFTPEFVALFSEKEKRWGNFELGRYGFIFENVRKFKQPVPAIGYRRLWNWTPPPNLEF